MSVRIPTLGRRVALLGGAAFPAALPPLPGGAPEEPGPPEPPAGVAPSSIHASGLRVAIDAKEDDVVATLSAPGATAPVTFLITGGADAALFYLDGNALKLAVDLQGVAAADELAVEVTATNAAGSEAVTLTFTAYEYGEGLAENTLLFVREAIGTGAPAGTIYSFGQPFAPGRVSSDGRVVCRVAGGVELDTQCDPQTWHEDGTVKHAIMAIAIPAIADGATVDIEFRTGANAAPGPDLDLDTEVSGRSLEVDFIAHDPDTDTSLPTWTFDVLANMPAWRRREGPLITETQVVVPIPEVSFGTRSGMFWCSVWVQRDGRLFATPWPANCAYDWPDSAARSVQCTMDVVMDGATVASKAGLLANNSGGVRFVVGRDAGGYVDMDCIFLRPPVAELVQAGLCGPYSTDLPMNFATGKLKTLAETRQAVDWDQWTTNGNIKALRGLIDGNKSGGDHGLYGVPFDEFGAAWVCGGPPVMYRTAIERAEAHGAEAYHHFDRANDCWLDTITRTNVRNYSTNANWVPKPGSDMVSGSWQRLTFKSDDAHQPMTQQLAVLFSGRLDLLDDFIARLSSSLQYAYNVHDGYRCWTSTTDMQARATAYIMNKVAVGLFTIPDNHLRWRPGYLAGNWAANMDWALDTYLVSPPYSLQGDVSGALYGSPPKFMNWHQVMVMMAAMLAWRQGLYRARDHMQWQRPFMTDAWRVTGVTGMPAALVHASSFMYDWPVGSKNVIDNWSDYVVAQGPSIQFWQRIPGANEEYVRMARMVLAMQAYYEPDDPDIEASCAAFEGIGWPGCTAADFAAWPKQAVFAPPGYPHFRELDP